MILSSKDKLITLIKDDYKKLEVSDIKGLVNDIGDISKLVMHSNVLPLDSILVGAVKNCSLSVIKYLIDSGAEVNGGNEKRLLSYYTQPIVTSIDYNRIDVFKLLLKKGAKPTARNNINQTLIQQAVIKNNYEMVSLLLDKRIDINSQDFNGRTALHQAAKNSNPQMITLLMNAGADKSLLDINGDKAIDILEYLKESGIEESSMINESINAINFKSIEAKKRSMDIFNSKKTGIKERSQGKRIKGFKLTP